MPAAGKATPTFLYIAGKPGGGRSMGIRRAKDRRHLTEQLRRQRLVTLQAWAMPSWAAVGSSGVSLKDQAEVHQQMSQLLTRGVPLVEALEVTAESVGPSTRPRIERIQALVAGGTSFSDACRTADLFDPVTIAVLKAAERTGDLGGAAKQLSVTTRRQLAIANKAVTLLIYPIIVLSLSVVVTTIMLAFIVPKIGEAIQKTGMQLPTFTRIVMAVGVTLRDHFLWVALGGVVLAALVVFTRRQIMAGLNILARKLPLLREVILAQETARFFTVMAAMVRSGIPLADALGVSVGAINHPRLKSQLSSLRTRLIEGGVLRVLIDKVDALPLPTRRLLIAAERSGDMESAFDVLAADMADELDRRSSRLLAALEPALIVLMFLIIGTLLLSIMIPLMKLSGQAMG